MARFNDLVKQKQFLHRNDIVRLMADVEVVALLDKLLVDKQEITGKEAEILWESGYVEEADSAVGWKLSTDGWTIANWKMELDPSCVGTNRFVERVVFYRAVIDGKLVTPEWLH